MAAKTKKISAEDKKLIADCVNSINTIVDGITENDLRAIENRRNMLLSIGDLVNTGMRASGIKQASKFIKEYKINVPYGYENNIDSWYTILSNAKLCASVIDIEKRKNIARDMSFDTLAQLIRSQPDKDMTKAQANAFRREKAQLVSFAIGSRKTAPRLTASCNKIKSGKDAKAISQSLVKNIVSELREKHGKKIDPDKKKDQKKPATVSEYISFAIYNTDDNGNNIPHDSKPIMVTVQTAALIVAELKQNKMEDAINFRNSLQSHINVYDAFIEKTAKKEKAS